MANEEKKKDLLAVLWSGADILRSKMDANEYKNYLLSFVFYKYLSDSYLVKAYDLIYDEEPKNIAEAQKTYEEAYEDKDLLEDLKDTFHYIISPELTYQRCMKRRLITDFKEKSYKKHLIPLRNRMHCLKICLMMLIYTQIDLELEIQSRVQR